MEKALPAQYQGFLADELARRKPVIDRKNAEGEATVFKMMAPLPKLGRDRFLLGATDKLTIMMTTYAAGDSGEIELHNHANEDHMFVVLQGAARFGNGAMEEFDLFKHEGILLPRGALYRFQVIGDEPLVMMRVGCTVNTDKPRSIRLDGQQVRSIGSAQKNTVPVEYITGAYFE